MWKAVSEGERDFVAIAVTARARARRAAVRRVPPGAARVRADARGVLARRPRAHRCSRRLLDALLARCRSRSAASGARRESSAPSATRRCVDAASRAQGDARRSPRERRRRPAHAAAGRAARARRRHAGAVAAPAQRDDARPRDLRALPQLGRLRRARPGGDARAGARPAPRASSPRWATARPPTASPRSSTTRCSSPTRRARRSSSCAARRRSSASPRCASTPTGCRCAASCCAAAGVKVCTVIGFPLGAHLPDVKAYEARRAVEQGAEEVDMVINIGALKSKDYALVEQDIRGVVQAVGKRHRRQGDPRDRAAHARREDHGLPRWPRRRAPTSSRPRPASPAAAPPSRTSS